MEPANCKERGGCQSLSEKMRVRVWIEGPDGASRDFELVETPRIGEKVSIAHGGRTEEGVVEAVTWQLLAMDAATPEAALEGEPVGSVSVVHVFCRPQRASGHADIRSAAVDPTEAGV